MFKCLPVCPARPCVSCRDPRRLHRYVWKLVYMFMLGYEIDFGHMEMISLISSTR